MAKKTPKIGTNRHQSRRIVCGHEESRAKSRSSQKTSSRNSSRAEELNSPLPSTHSNIDSVKYRRNSCFIGAIYTIVCVVRRPGRIISLDYID